MKKHLKEIIEDAKMNAGYEICCMGDKTPEKLLLAINVFWSIYWSIRISILSKVCKRKGHDWLDESYGGPDSGCMAGTCQRCGYSFHHQLY